MARTIFFAIIVITLAAIAAVFFYHAKPAVKEAVTVPDEKPVIGWRKDFTVSSGAGAIPEGWKLQGKPWTKQAVFSVRTDARDRSSFLRMEADRASASIITVTDGLDIRKTPMLRWRWRVTVLPEGADGRFENKDDQAIGIYVGTGSALDNKSVSYRWDTETPKGAQGDAAYGLGGIKVKWHTLRNKEDAVGGEWFTEERDIAEDFNKAWGFCPDKL